MQHDTRRTSRLGNFLDAKNKPKEIWNSLLEKNGIQTCNMEKINKYAFSGGKDTIENQRKFGADLEVDIPIKYLGFFLDDDTELEHIRREYKAGRMLTGEVKQRLIEVLIDVVERHRRARAAVTDEMVDAFMAVRPLPNMFS